MKKKSAGCGATRTACAVLRKVSQVVAEKEEKHHEQNDHLD